MGAVLRDKGKEVGQALKGRYKIKKHQAVFSISTCVVILI